MTLIFLWFPDFILCVLTHAFSSSSHLLAECIKSYKNNHIFWCLEISKRITFHRKKWTRSCQAILCTEVASNCNITQYFCTWQQTPSTPHSSFFLFSFFYFLFFEVHCCYPYKVPKVKQRAGVSNVYLFSKTAEERSLFVITNLSGSVFKGYFPNFSLFFFFCMFDTLGATLFLRSFFLCAVQLGWTSSFYTVKTHFFSPSICSTKNNPFDSHPGLLPLQQAVNFCSCEHKHDVLVTPGVSIGAALKICIWGRFH